jgi:hypothetical protein
VRTRGPGESALLLLDAAALLADEGIPYAVIGGLAAAVHGSIRASNDADAVLSVNAAGLRQLDKKFLAAGFQTQLKTSGFDDPIPAVLVLHDGYGNKVDLLAGLRGLESAAFSRAVIVPFDGEALRVIGREDFIAMKVFAGGPKDMADALTALRVAGAATDLELVRRLARLYGKSTLEAFERMLKQ